MAIAQDWKVIVDTVISDFGLTQDDIPTGEILASSGGDEVTFRSKYKGAAAS